MQRFHRTGLGLMAVLAIAIGMMTTTASAQSIPEPPYAEMCSEYEIDSSDCTSSSTSSSGGCLIPSLAAYANGFYVDVELSLTPKVCSKQCADLRKGCKKVAGASQKCVDAGFKGYMDSYKRYCGGLDSPESRRYCTMEASYIRMDFRQFLRQDARVAAGVCAEWLMYCREDCNAF